jgi:hypothetical protein
MKIVCYVCVAVHPDERVFRRIRVSFDLSKDMSKADLTWVGDDHHSCNHRSTCHEYLTSREVEQLYDLYSDRLHNPRVGGIPSHPGSSTEVR